MFYLHTCCSSLMLRLLVKLRILDTSYLKSSNYEVIRTSSRLHEVEGVREGLTAGLLFSRRSASCVFADADRVSMDPEQRV